MTATAGLYARAALPAISQPVMAYPLLAELTLPPVAKGIFYIGMLATIMSTLNSLAFISATTLGRDIVWRMKKVKDSDSATFYTRIGLIVTGLLSIGLSILIPSVIKLWYTIGTVVIPALLVPLVTSYFEKWRVGAHFAFASMFSGWCVSLSWLILGWSGGITDPSYPFGIEPMYPGLVASIVIWGLGVNGRFGFRGLRSGA
jgi:SSS family solute:Na+ symporter